MSGRKPEAESRAAEFRQRLVIWKQTPESLRPSLRALARELGTSHQLLAHYLTDLDDWQARQRYLEAKRRADEKAERIKARAAAEGRGTSWDMPLRDCLDAYITPGVLDHIESMRQKAMKGPLLGHEWKILAMWAKHPESSTARELLNRREQVGTARPPRRPRLGRLIERFEEMDGMILPDDAGRVSYFLPRETPASRALLTQLVRYRGELKRGLEQNAHRFNFADIKAKIAQRFPGIPLKPLE